MHKFFSFLACICAAGCFSCKNPYRPAPPAAGFAVIAYYSGNSSDIERYDASQLTHIIYSFLHLKGNMLTVDNSGDSLTIRKLVGLKDKNPGLKVLLSLGGWGGCEPCSAVFNTPQGRSEFASSLKALMRLYGADGIDLDWEYPAIEGYPGHPYTDADKTNFTLLVRELRSALGGQAIISFAAGGFQDFLDKSVEWDKVMPLVNYVNLMSYDLVNGFSKITGHHTPPLFDARAGGFDRSCRKTPDFAGNSPPENNYRRRLLCTGLGECSRREQRFVPSRRIQAIRSLSYV